MLYNFCGIAVAAYRFGNVERGAEKNVIQDRPRTRLFKSQIGWKIGGELSHHYQSCLFNQFWRGCSSPLFLARLRKTLVAGEKHHYAHHPTRATSSETQNPMCFSDTGTEEFT